MHFGTTLHESVYTPWKDKYIDYAKLKSLLRVHRSEDEAQPWTEDENRFCDEIFNTQLEGVAQFQEQHVNALKQRIDSAFDKLKELATVEPTDDNATPQSGETSASRLRTLQTELDEITNEIRELKKYSNINYTGFLKIVKKHDRKRGDRYKLRPMMQLSLAQRPFNSEQGYSPLLNKLSILYFAIRQQLEDGGEQFPPLDLETQGETYHGERYIAHKCMSLPHPRSTRTRETTRHESTDTPLQFGSIPTTSLRSRRTSFDTYRPSSTATKPPRTWVATTRPQLPRST